MSVSGFDVPTINLSSNIDCSCDNDLCDLWGRSIFVASSSFLLLIFFDRLTVFPIWCIIVGRIELSVLSFLHSKWFTPYIKLCTYAPVHHTCTALALYKHLTSTLQAPYKHPTSTLQAPYKHPTSTLQAPYKQPTSTLQAPYKHPTVGCSFMQE